MTTETTRGSEQAEATPARLPDHLLEMLRRPSLCFVSTLAEDGTPHATRAWADTEGRHILVSSREDADEARNAARDGRVAVAVADPDDPAQMYRVRGRILDITSRGAREQHRVLARRHLGDVPSPREDDDRPLVLVIEPYRVQFAA